jgi:hypothetical protein
MNAPSPQEGHQEGHQEGERKGERKEEQVGPEELGPVVIEPPVHPTVNRLSATLSIPTTVPTAPTVPAALAVPTMPGTIVTIRTAVPVRIRILRCIPPPEAATWASKPSMVWGSRCCPSNRAHPAADEEGEEGEEEEGETAAPSRPPGS